MCIKLSNSKNTILYYYTGGNSNTEYDPVWVCTRYAAFLFVFIIKYYTLLLSVGVK